MIRNAGLRTTATSFEAPVSAASHHPGDSTSDSKESPQRFAMRRQTDIRPRWPCSCRSPPLVRLLLPGPGKDQSRSPNAGARSPGHACSPWTERRLSCSANNPPTTKSAQLSTTASRTALRPRKGVLQGQRQRNRWIQTRSCYTVLTTFRYLQAPRPRRADPVGSFGFRSCVNERCIDLSETTSCARLVRFLVVEIQLMFVQKIFIVMIAGLPNLERLDRCSARRCMKLAVFQEMEKTGREWRAAAR